MSIVVKDLVKSYGSNKVVHAISFSLEQGEFVGLLGPSGCGKTTTLRCIAGLEDANGGTISIEGEVVSDPANGIMRPAHSRNVGMVFQSYAIWPHMTVAQNVGFPLTIRKMGKKEVAERVDWALGIVGMQELAARLPSQLSGGQQQRVALARAVVGQPRVLLFDEPLSNLDAKLRDATRAEIRRLQRQLNIAAIYVTHDQAEALSMSDRVIVMDRGHIMQEGPPKDLYRRPANRFVADFVGVASFVEVMPTDDRLAWRTPDGTTIRVAEPAPATSAGGAMQLMVRPEAALLSPASAAPAGHGRNVLPGRIVEASYLGSHTEYVVEMGGSRVRIHSGDDLEHESDVIVSFAPTDAQLIPISRD
ncbi:MAG: ABC transporter ATP-binding protein [Hyphomicrobiaceae bacterium]